MNPLSLVSYLSAGDAYDWGCYARLDIDPESARTLLLWRSRWEVIKVVAGPDLYTLRAWDLRVRFYNSNDPALDWTDDVETEWVAVPADAEDFRERDEVRTDCDAIEVEASGVRWRAYAGDIPIETAGLTWDELDVIAAGSDPFAKQEAHAS
jgi:hypothetical protein